MASIFIIYGLVLGVLGWLTQQATPTSNRMGFLIGVSGCGLSVLWGVLAFAGLKGRTLATLSAIAVTVALMTRVVDAWLGAGNGANLSMIAKLLLTAMFLLSMGVVVYLFHGERQPEFYERNASHGKAPNPNNDPKY